MDWASMTQGLEGSLRETISVLFTIFPPLTEVSIFTSGVEGPLVRAALSALALATRSALAREALSPLEGAWTTGSSM